MPAIRAVCGLFGGHVRLTLIRGRSCREGPRSGLATSDNARAGRTRATSLAENSVTSVWRGCAPYCPSSSSNVLAFRRSRVSNPCVNQL